MTKNQVTIVESWKLSFKGEILADVRHFLQGLPPGTVLQSLESGQRWKVVYRILFSQALEQKRFRGEKEVYQHISFAAPKAENIERFYQTLADKESKGIYHYALEPLGHTNKPRGGEQMQVEVRSNEV